MMKYLFARWIVVLLVLGMCALPAWGKEANPDETRSQVMETMVVTAGRLGEKKQNLTTNITIFTQEDIRQSSVQELSDLLAKEGFMIREYPNSTISVGIRGLRTETHGNDLSSHVLILINGRRAGTGNLAKISMDNVERIELIRGPGSVQYGASAMGGVINIITRQGDGKPSVFAETTLGSWDFKGALAGFSGQFKNFDLSATFSKSSQDDYDTAEGSRYYNTGYDTKERASFNAGWTFAPKNRVGFTYTGYEGDKIGKPDYLSKNNQVQYIDHALKSADLVYDGQTSDGFLLWNLRYFKGKDEYETFDPSKKSEHTYYRDTDHQGLQAQVTAKWEFAHVTAGGDWTDYAIRNTYTRAGGENTYENPAGFLMAKTMLMEDKLVLSAGGRYDKYEVTSDDGRSKNKTHWSPSAGAVYKFTSLFSVRANYAQAFRMPTTDELFMYNDYSASGYGIWSGNPELNPEKSKTCEIGIDYNRGSLKSGITYFHTKFDDKISYAYDTASGITQYKNIEGATISGMEATLAWDIGSLFGWSYELSPYVSFTALTEYTDESTGKDLQYTPEWTASYGLRFSQTDHGFSSRLNFSHIGQQDIFDYEGTGATSLGRYTVADLMISKQFFSFEKYGSVNLNAEITNLFNESYAVVQGYPMPGRSFYAGLKYTF
ncbi:MAG: TonB-dependent receptor [Proteobacteria bacterium]|nr:TonB-dependent receptor [Desulfobacula sp.]MBU4132320.1 TonB-dependent receptor [Pseudomonadota bacterium]